MKLFRHIIILSAALVLASCAIDEPWTESNHVDGEDVLMTFTPSFVDFEAATKAIGDGTQVNTLLVHVYEGESNTPMKYTYNIYNREVEKTVSIPFFHGKDYKVYFFAYNSSDDTYEISANGLIDGITINYPSGEQTYDALEALDAFCSVKNINLSADDLSSDVTLTRPFAQVNLAANKDELSAASATKVEISINAARTYNLGTGATSNAATQTFTFVSDNNFQSNEIATNGNVYLGTTYLFVPSDATELEATITLYDADGNILNDPATPVQIPLASNSRTNLVFSGVEPAGPAAIIIETPEDLESFLLNGADEETKAVIAENIDMSGKKLSPKSFKSLELDGNGKTITGLTFSLFNEASDVNVYDLTIADAAITGATHVGVLVNTLKGTGTFTDINIINSSVSTTNGAAGGLVGYISKPNEKSREEDYIVTFKSCEVNGVTIAGSSSEGKFVGLLSGYDNQEVVEFTECSATNTSVSDYTSVYISSNQSSWLDSIEDTYDGWLGHETYRRGIITFDGTRLVPRWDGKTATAKADLLLYNGETNKYEVYSPFDLAGVRNATASPAALYLMENVDMFGQGKDGKFNIPSEFTESAYNSTDDNNFNSFSYVSTLEGFNNTIYNLKIEHLAQGSTTAAFIGGASGTTYHQNTTFDGCCVVSTHKVVTTDAKAYAAIVCCNPGGTYTMENITARNCKTFGLQKVGTLCSRVSGTSTLKNNTVRKCYVENYECNIVERFESGKKTMAGFTIDNIYADFYPHGEVGGMYGFIQGTATLSNCQVIESTICAYGQGDKMAEIKASGWKGALAVLGLKGLGYYKVPGRHVNAMIGNIRVTGGNIAISGCTIDANSKCTRSSDVHNSSYKIIGQAYYVFGLDGTSDPGVVTVDNNKLTLANCNSNTTL